MRGTHVDKIRLPDILTNGPYPAELPADSEMKYSFCAVRPVSFLEDSLVQSLVVTITDIRWSIGRELLSV